MSSNTNSFSDVKSFFYEGGAYDGAANLILESGKAALKDSSNKLMLTNLGRSAIKEFYTGESDFIYRKSLDTTIAANGTLTVTLTGDEEFIYGASATLTTTEKKDLILVMNESVANTYVAGEIIDLSGKTVTTDGTQKILTVDLGVSVVSPRDVTFYHDVKIEDVKPRGKTLDTYYIKVDANNNVSDTYTLGLPDVYSLEGVWTGNTYSESETDITSKFTLKENQKDSYYDLSYITASSTTGIVDGDKVLIKVKAFAPVTTGDYDDTFFTVDSYPVDDVTETLPADKIRTQEISKYKDTKGETHYLRDVIDFRPYAANTAAYSTTIGGATEDPSDVTTFDSSVKSTPAIGKRSQFSYDYYLARYDRVILDKDGRFGFINGLSSEHPTPPSESDKTMTLAIMYVPPFPALPKSVADASNVARHAVRLNRKNNRNYTMKDIGKIDHRVKNLEYYTALNSLEKKATDYTVTDADGLDRFKNGIFVDPFANFQMADVRNTEFGIGIDPGKKELHPRFRVFPIDVKVANTTNVTDWGESITLPITSGELIKQPQATNQRSCTTNFYKWNGNVQLNPEFDGNVDYTKAPDLNMDIDLVTPFTDYTEMLQEFIPAMRPSSEVLSIETNRTVSDRESGIVSRGTGTRRVSSATVETETIETILNNPMDVNVDTKTSLVGDFVSDVRFSSYLNSRTVDVYVTGLRPNTRVWFYFDGVSIFDYCAPAILDPNTSTTGLSGPKVIPTADFSSSNVIRTDANGVLIAQFLIPADTFYVGDRVLEIADVSTYSDIGLSATTYAKKTYGGFNNSISRTTIAVNTRTPEIDFNSVVEQNTVRTVETVASSVPVGDPIAQTFYIDKDYSSDTVVFINKLDVFFSKKSETVGVTVQIRDVVNGFPGPNILPFSSVHLDSDDVVASDSVATGATTVQFKGPVGLATGKEYCFVVLPDGSDPDYRIWISKVGETDVDTGDAVNQDGNSGTLFVSTNNRAWTAHQDENIKFTLHKATFTSKSRHVYFENGDIEFLEIENVNGAFQNGEKVFTSNTDLTGTIEVSAGNTEIVGTSTTFTTDFVAEEYLVYRPTANTYQILQIDEITSDTAMTVKDVPFVANTAANFYKSVVGTVSYYHSAADPVVMALEDSSAKTGLVFAANTTIIGARSGSNGDIIEVRDEPVSYMMPKIFRTNFTKTYTDMVGCSFYGSTTGGLYSKDVVFNNYTRFRSEPTYVKSKSNEIKYDSGAKSFTLKVNLYNTSDTTVDSSPFIDHSISKIDLYEYLVGNDLTNEHTNLGAATSKYISKDLSLVDGFEAEDISVLLTGYRPTGSNIDVYIKFKSDYDVRSIDQLPWSKLINTNESDLYSSPSNPDDMREFEYKLNTDDQTYEYGAWLNSNDTIDYLNSDGTTYYD